MVCAGMLAACIGLSGFDEGGDYLWFGGALVVGVAAVLVLVKMTFSRDRTPDFLLEMGLVPFEKDGVCFAPAIYERESGWHPRRKRESPQGARPGDDAPCCCGGPSLHER